LGRGSRRRRELVEERRGVNIKTAYVYDIYTTINRPTVHYRSSDKNNKLIKSNVKKTSLMRVGKQVCDSMSLMSVRRLFHCRRQGKGC